MQNSFNYKNASLDNTRVNQAMSSNVHMGEQNFIPASMVQNILEWQRQALESKFLTEFIVFCNDFFYPIVKFD